MCKSALSGDYGGRKNLRPPFYKLRRTLFKAYYGNYGGRHFCDDRRFYELRRSRLIFCISGFILKLNHFGFDRRAELQLRRALLILPERAR